MTVSRRKLPVVCSFESRRAEEICALIRRNDGVPLSAPSMREIPIGENPVALQFVRDCIADQFACVILLTGVGTDALFEVAKTENLDGLLHDALLRTTIIIRGPKPAAVLHKRGLRYDLKAPEPNTWRELLSAIDEAALTNPARFNLAAKAVAVQEYGLPNQRLYEELRRREAIVTPVPVYRWGLPEDITPLQTAIRSAVAGDIDIILFTSANQVTNVLSVAEDLGLSEPFQTACQSVLVVSIGPTCSEAILDSGLPVNLEASPPKMGPMVREAIRMWTEAGRSATGD